MQTIKLNILLLAAVLFLASCGGSSSSPSFEGVYTGSYTNGVQLTDIVLDDGSFWSLYSPQSANGTAFEGFSKGKVDSKDGKFNVPSLTHFEQPGDQITSGTGTGTYTSSSAAGTITIVGGETLSFNVTKLPSKNYTYDKHADLSAVVGRWTGKLLDGEDSTIQIQASGIFTGESSDGCEFNGKFEPRSGHANIFNVTVNFSSTPCVFPNQAASGIAFTTLRDDGKNQLLATAVLDSLKAGLLFSAVR